MSETNGYLYILLHKLYDSLVLTKIDNMRLCKIGSTKCIYSRMMVYKTGFSDMDNNNCELTIIHINESKYSCYELDSHINYLSKHDNYPYKHYEGTGGNEFYYVNNIENLEEFLQRLQVKYKIEKCDINNLFKNKENINYSLIRDEYFNELNRITPMNESIIKKQLLEIGILDELNAKIINPRSKQMEALNTAIKMYETEGIIKGIIYAPPGSGKSIMAVMIVNYILSQNPDKYIIWITEQKNILDSIFTNENIISWKKSNLLQNDINIIKRKDTRSYL